MKLKSHSLKTKVFIEKYNSSGKLIEEREINTNNNSDANIIAEKYSEDNKLLSSESFPVNSSVRNFVTVLSGSFGDVTFAYVTKSDASVGGMSIVNLFRYAYPILQGDDRVGVIVGKNQGGISTISSDSVVLTDYNLKNQILHSSAPTSGTLHYLDSIHTDLHVSESFEKISYGRVFNNITDETINIGEIGLVNSVQGTGTTVVDSTLALMYRDIKDYNGNTINIDLLPSQSLYAKYDFSLNTSSLLPNRNWLKLIDLESKTSNFYSNINCVAYTNYFSYRNDARSGSVSLYRNQRVPLYYSSDAGDEFLPNISSPTMVEVEYLPSTGYKWLKVPWYNNSNDYNGALFTGKVNVTNFDITYLTRTESTASYAGNFSFRTGAGGIVGFKGTSILFNSSSLRLKYKSNYATTQWITSSLGKEYYHNTNYYIRIYALDSLVKAKMWESGSAEPGTWDIETNNMTASYDSGFLLKGSYENMENYTYFNDFELTNLDQQTLNSNSSFGNYVFDGIQDRIKIKAGAGVDGYGIVVGTSDNVGAKELISAVSPSYYDWRLNNQMQHGSGSIDKIYYGDSSISNIETSISSSYIELYRTFLNKNDLDTEFSEIGLYTRCHPNETKYSSICIGRVSTGVSPISLSNMETAVLKIRFYFNS